MAGFSGKNGKVVYGASDFLEVTKWSFTPTSNNPSWASSTNPGYKKRVAGVKDGSGNVEGKDDATTHIWDAIQEGSSVTLKLYVNASDFITVPSLVDQLNIECDMDDGEPVSWNFDFSTNGAWTYP